MQFHDKRYRIDMDPYEVPYLKDYITSKLYRYLENIYNDQKSNEDFIPTLKSIFNI